ncbi:MAG: hypothetical protein NVS9B15_23220 [Acidobacteriaceae bacterium]
MRLSTLFAGVACCAATLSIAQTADELVAKNIEAHGGVAAIKAITSLRSEGRFEQQGIIAQVRQDSKKDDLIRQSLSLQGMTQIQAYDGKIGWQISPFQGRKDPEMLGEDDLRDLSETADFYGPLVDYKEKGNRVEFVGHDTVDGDDALRLKVTLKNGDIYNYYLDPDTYLEIRIEKQEFIRGSVHETITNLGSYKKVNDVYFPFSSESGQRRDPNGFAKITLTSIVANPPLEDSEFTMPASPATPSPQRHAEPPANEQKPDVPKTPDVSVPKQ